MTTRILVLNAHPHTDDNHYCAALADAYEAGAREGGHAVKRIDLADLDYPVLRDPAEFEAPPPPDVLAAQEATLECNHLVVVFPVWLGAMPAYSRAFFEQFARAHFALAENPEGGWPIRRLKGRSARVIATMGMPAAAYRLMFKARGVRAFAASTLAMSGFKPVRETLIGMVGVGDDKGRLKRRLEQVRALGVRGR
ncbi:MAG: NAD(P)H-dependent oxidoreductase [Pseudomonadota bacterium]